MLIQSIKLEKIIQDQCGETKTGVVCVPAAHVEYFEKGFEVGNSDVNVYCARVGNYKYYVRARDEDDACSNLFGHLIKF